MASIPEGTPFAFKSDNEEDGGSRTPSVSGSTHMELFRLTVHPHPDFPLYGHQAIAERGRPALLREAIKSATRWEVRQGSIWSVARAQDVDETALHFKFGRHRKMVLPFPVESPSADATDYVEREVDLWPHTDIIVDVQLALCAIGRKPELAEETTTIARALEVVLTTSPTARDSNLEIKASPIDDPQEFLERLRSAFSVKKLWVTIQRPNPFDVEQDFHLPTERVLAEMGGQEARVVWSGKNLNSKNPEVEKIVESVARSGGDYGATIQETQDPRSKTRVKKRRKGKAMEVSSAARLNPRSLLDMIRDLYNSLRR